MTEDSTKDLTIVPQKPFSFTQAIAGMARVSLFFSTYIRRFKELLKRTMCTVCAEVVSVLILGKTRMFSRNSNGYYVQGVYRMML